MKHQNKEELNETHQVLQETLMTKQKKKTWGILFEYNKEFTATKIASLALIVSTLFTPVFTVPSVVFSNKTSLK